MNMAALHRPGYMLMFLSHMAISRTIRLLVADASSSAYSVTAFLVITSYTVPE